MSKKRPVGVLYSTNPDFEYQYDEEPEAATLEPSQQRLRVSVERHHRGGKTATVVRGFVGTTDDLEALARQLKSKCGVGGSAKDGEVVIQVDLKDKVTTLLKGLGYSDSK